MLRAIELARKGMENGAGGPFGAVVVKDGEIVGEGSNLVTSTNDPTAHAEVDRDSKCVSKFEQFSTRRLHNLHFLRTLPDVSRRDLLGASGENVFSPATAKMRRKSVLTTSLFTRKSKNRFLKEKSKASIFCAKKALKFSIIGQING